MGDAAGEPADALQPLALEQLLLDGLALVLEALPLGHLGLERSDSRLQLRRAGRERLPPTLQLLLMGNGLQQGTPDGPAELVDHDPDEQRGEQEVAHRRREARVPEQRVGPDRDGRSRIYGDRRDEQPDAGQQQAGDDQGNHEEGEVWAAPGEAIRCQRLGKRVDEEGDEQPGHDPELAPSEDEQQQDRNGTNVRFGTGFAGAPPEAARRAFDAVAARNVTISAMMIACRMYACLRSTGSLTAILASQALTPLNLTR